ncbi:MAG: phosphoribosylglycinamide formyltransferase [Parvibaculales bacterium]
MTRPIRIAILFSGGGSNMKALAAHIAQPHIAAELVLTISNRPDAGGIRYCRDEQIPCQIIDHKAYESRADFDAALDAALEDAEIDLICAAGFMRLLTPEFVTKWENKILNIHPALLPKFKGLNTHARAIEAGETEHGCSVHYMRPEMDEGPILVQKSVSVLPDDTPETLAARVLEQEHIAYPEALDMALAKLST